MGKVYNELETIRSNALVSPNFRWPKTPRQLREHLEQRAGFHYETVDQACCGYLDHVAMAELAERLGNADDGAHYQQLAEKSRQAILARMWNERDGFFYNLDTRTDEQAPVKTFVGFYPFWARIADKRHAAILTHLYDPKVFWAERLPPMLSLDYPRRKIMVDRWPFRYWNYPSWPYGLCRLADAACNAAKSVAPDTAGNAAELLRRFTRHAHFPRGDLARPCIPEFVDPHKGLQRFSELDYNHSYYIDLVIRHLVGLEPSMDDRVELLPLPAGLERFSLEGVKYKGHDVSIRWDAESGYELWVDGKRAARRDDLGPITYDLPATPY